MAAARGRASTDRWGLPGLFGRWLTLGVVLVILVLGGVVSVLLYRQADQNASAQENDLATRAARTLVNTTAVLDAGFAGSAAVVDIDGTVGRAGFDAFADAVAPATKVRTIGYEPIVADADRAAFEPRIGSPITEIGPTGQFMPAATRPTYAPLQWTRPEVGSSSTVIGFDVSSDPTRNEALAAARDSGSTAFSAPIHRQPDGPLAVFVVQALYRPGAIARHRRGSPGQRRRLRHGVGPERHDRRRDDRPGRLRRPPAGHRRRDRPRIDGPDARRRPPDRSGRRRTPVGRHAAAPRTAPHQRAARRRRDAARRRRRRPRPGAQPAQDAGVALQRPLGAGARPAQRAPRRGRIARPDGRRDRHLCAGRGRRATCRRSRWTTRHTPTHWCAGAAAARSSPAGRTRCSTPAAWAAR